MDLINYFICQWNIGLAQGKAFVKLRKSQLLLQFVHVFYSLGFLSSFEITNQSIFIFGLKEIALKQVSKPGNRKYWKYKDLRNLSLFYLIQTSYGLTTNLEVNKLHIGGELIMTVRLFRR